MGEPITLEQQIASVAREIALRRAVYPKWVALKKMKQTTADHELAAMEAVIETVRRSTGCPPRPPAVVRAEINKMVLAISREQLSQEQAMQHIADYCLSGAAEAWVPVGARLPDDDLTVMVALKDSDEPVWFGYHDADGWSSATDAMPITKLVTHWKPTPAPPDVAI